MPHARHPHQRLDARARRERRARLVERDVAVGADAAEEELDAAVGLDLALVLLALLLQILRIAIQQMHVLASNAEPQSATVAKKQ